MPPHVLGQTGSGACPLEVHGSPGPLSLIVEEPLICKHLEDRRIRGDSRAVEWVPPQTPSGRAHK